MPRDLFGPASLICAPDADAVSGGAGGGGGGSPAVASDLDRVSAGGSAIVDEGPDLRSYVKERYGFEYADDFDDEKIVGDLATKAKSAREYEENVRLQQERIRMLEHQLSQRPLHQHEPAPAPTAQERRELAGLLAHWNAVPEFDRQWLSMLTRDENGNLVAKPGARPDLPQLVESYNEWQRGGLETFLHNPLAFVYQAITQTPLLNQLREAWTNDVRQQFVTLHRQNQIQDLFQKNAEWMLVRDAEGNPTGLSEEGAAIARVMEALEQANDGQNYLYRHLPPAELWRIARLRAEEMLGRKLTAKKPAGPNGQAKGGDGAAAAPARDPREERKLQVLRNAGRMPERGGSRSTEHSPNPKLNRLSAVDQALELAREQGVIARDSD